jgi:hypothetical protein
MTETSTSLSSSSITKTLEPLSKTYVQIELNAA